jgi:hypothetical protein
MAELKPGKKFCTNCGTAVNGPEKDAASSKQKNTETPVFYLGEHISEKNSYADIWDRHIEAMKASGMEVCNDFQHLLDKK